MSTGTYEGDVYTKLDSPSLTNFPMANLARGRVYCSTDRCVAATATGLTLGSTFKCGKLPAGANVLFSIVYPVATATYDAPDATTGATTASLGITGDTDLFGDITTLASATPQFIMPKPDGTTYTDCLDPLAADVDVILTSAAVDWTTAEGVVVKIFYTM
jgi:hypothetical protein